MTHSTTTAPLALRPRDAARALSISPRTLWSLTANGQIPHVRLGDGRRRIVLYAIDDLRRWLAERTSKEGQ